VIELVHQLDHTVPTWRLSLQMKQVTKHIALMLVSEAAMRKNLNSFLSEPIPSIINIRSPDALPALRTSGQDVVIFPAGSPVPLGKATRRVWFTRVAGAIKMLNTDNTVIPLCMPASVHTQGHRQTDNHQQILPASQCLDGRRSSSNVLACVLFQLLSRTRIQWVPVSKPPRVDSFAVESCE